MDETLRSIVSVASRLCREQGIQASTHTIAYTACIQDVRKALEAAGPGTTVLNALDRDTVAAVSQLVVKQLADKDDPMLAAAKMQVMMEVVFMQQRELLSREAQEKDERIGMLSREASTRCANVLSDVAAAVTEHKSPQGVAGHERIFARVLEYVSVAGGMELAVTDDMAKEEVRVAMESVFPLSTLVRFTTLAAEERQQQIESLAKITAGICLYNQTLGRGGTALPPGAASYMPQAKRLLRDIDRHIVALSADISAYAALCRLHTPAPGKNDNPESQATRERALAESVHKAQALVLWEGLKEDLAAGLQAVTALDNELQHWLMQVHDTVGNSSAVPKEAILPSFERLGTIHQALGEELRMLVVRQRLAEELVTLMDGYVTLLQRIAKTRRPGKKTSVELELANWQAQRNEWTAQAPEQMEEDCVWEPGRDPSSTGAQAESQESGYDVVEVSVGGGDEEATGAAANSSSVPSGLAYNGFDPVVLGSHGHLARADVKLGFITYNDVVYGFSSPETMAAFAASPSKAVAAVHEAIIAQPVLARLLGRSAAYPALNLAQIVQAVAGPLKVDFGCQTPTHFVEKNMDYSYEWNVWALRRRALSLANLRQKRTHSTQTGLSHFKRDADSQVWQPKAAQVQTRVNKGQTMPKKLQYVTGLRGSPATKMHVVRLELELGQPHQH